MPDDTNIPLPTEPPAAAAAGAVVSQQQYGPIPPMHIFQTRPTTGVPGVDAESATQPTAHPDIEADYNQQQKKNSAIATSIFTPENASTEDLQTLQTAQAFGWTPETELALQQAHKAVASITTAAGAAVPESMQELEQHPFASALKVAGFAVAPGAAVGATLGGQSVDSLVDKYVPADQNPKLHGALKLAGGLVGSMLGAGSVNTATGAVSHILDSSGTPIELGVGDQIIPELDKASANLSPEEIAAQTRSVQEQLKSYAEGLKKVIAEPTDTAERNLKPGTILNAEDTAALNIKTNTRVDRLTNFAHEYMVADSSEKKGIALEALKQEVVPTSEIIKAGVGVSAEHGRALAIHNTDWDTVKDVQSILAQKGDRDWDATARALASLASDPDSADKAEKVKTFLGGVLNGRSVYKALVNAILLNPRLAATKIVTDAIYQPYNITMQSLATGVRFRNFSAAGKLWTGAMHGTIAAIPDAWKFAKASVISGSPEFEKTISEINDPKIFAQDFDNTIPGKAAGWISSAFGVGTRTIVGIDQFAKCVTYSAEMHTQAFYRGMEDAEKLGLSGTQAVRQATAQAAAYMKAMPGWLQRAAQTNMAKDTFTDEDAYTQAASTVVNAVPGMKLIAPFTRTPINILENGMMSSPYAFATHKYWRDIHEGGLAQGTANAKMAFGSIMTGWMVYEAAQGHIIGNAPTDPASRAQFMKANPQEESIRLPNGDLISVKHLGPVGQQMVQAANYAQFAGYMKDDQEKTNIMLGLIGSMAKIGANAPLLETTMNTMSFLSEAFKAGASEDPRGVSKSFRKFVGNEAAAFIPAPLKIAADAARGYHVEVNGMMDAIKSHIPGFGLPPERDQWGAVQYLPHGSGPDDVAPSFVDSVLNSLNPLTIDHDRAMDAVDKEQMRVHFKASRTPDSLWVHDPTFPIPIDPQAKDRWSVLAGNEIKLPKQTGGFGMVNQHENTEALIESNFYKQIGEEARNPDIGKLNQAKELEKMQRMYVEAARKQLIRERPDLAELAINRKILESSKGSLTPNIEGAISAN